MMENLSDRIGELCRNGKTIYYAIFGQAMIESHDRNEVLRMLQKYEAKLPEWDKRR